MLRLAELRLPLDHPPAALRAAVLARLGLAEPDLIGIAIIRRGYDARKPRAIRFVYTIDVALRDEAAVLRRHHGDRNLRAAPDMEYRLVARAPEGAARPVVVGTGPCGLMAALTLAQMGFRPVILERGTPVRQRTKDTWALWRRGVLSPESNVQFGEGGAGLFSDGKLYSGIKDPRHLGRRLMQQFVRFGAPEEILSVSKPHIGTFRLVTVVENMRAEIERLGGEYRFGARMADLMIEPDPDGTRKVRGVVLADGAVIAAEQVVLAIGHSARDSFAMLRARGVAMQAKPFSVGVRIEHPQGMIDRARLGAQAGNPALGAADYRLVHHCRGLARSVYSFCMCPGGRVVAATSEPGRVVTNGMSQYSRAEFNANAGIVVGVDPARDYPGRGAEAVLAGVGFQRVLESAAFLEGGGDYRAPAQLVGDFLAGRASTALGEVAPSYRPGVRPADLSRCLPAFVVAAMREALPAFEAQIPGFARADAVMTGVETRTSSPVRIGRGEGFESLNTRGLFPAGEGAGYAGGILSAGVDGIRVAEAAALQATGREVTGEMRRETRATTGGGTTLGAGVYG
ncbi:MAG: hypothetical protein K2X49_23435 [Acetobacteraceae bacterium]|nr:hypothetical protein [Acetobacteraceae bacterium]